VLQVRALETKAGELEMGYQHSSPFSFSFTLLDFFFLR
jgi:hypothetical protein